MKRVRTFLLTVLFATSGFIASAQTVQTLVFFNATNGAQPYAALTLGNDGNFYGTTCYGGTNALGGNNGNGTVFKMTTNGSLTTLVSFNGTNGTAPVSALTLGSDGNFYGTTSAGGTNRSAFNGTAFKVTTNGTLTTLVSFNGSNGSDPVAALTPGNDGNFYGTTYYGGNMSLNSGNGYGTVFQVTTDGTLTRLYSFTNGPDCRWPEAGLTLGTDGNFYGMTTGGNSSSGKTYPYGTVFRVTTNGTLTTLVSFNVTNGSNPFPTLTPGNDGNFYGTTENGGSNNVGTVFKVTTNGTLTTLVSFNGHNGANPTSALTLGTDGNFYGTTDAGVSRGTVFMVTTNGTLTTLASFNGSNGEYPNALTLGTDGNFYGTTQGEFQGGGRNRFGTVFRLILAPVITVQPQNQTNDSGLTELFTVTATSYNPMSYQWQKNGTNLVDGGNISGSATNTLTITGISDSDAACYSVIVTNAFGSVTNFATLTVIDPPTLAVQFVSGNLQLNLAGMLSNNFVVQYSTNLAGTNWVNLLSLTNLPASPYQFLDPAGIVPPARFYRAVMQ